MSVPPYGKTNFFASKKKITGNSSSKGCDPRTVSSSQVSLVQQPCPSIPLVITWVEVPNAMPLLLSSKTGETEETPQGGGNVLF